MIRRALLLAALGLTACAEPPPPMQVDGEIIMRAVQHAQAQADGDRRGRELAAAEAQGK